MTLINRSGPTYVQTAPDSDEKRSGQPSSPMHPVPLQPGPKTGLFRYGAQPRSPLTRLLEFASGVVPKPPSSTLVWPASSSPTAASTTSLGKLNRKLEALPSEVTESGKVAGYRGAVTSHGSVQSIETFLHDGTNALTRLPPAQKRGSGRRLVELVTDATRQQLSAPRVAGYALDPSSGDLHFQVGEHSTKPAFGQQASRSWSAQTLPLPLGSFGSASKATDWSGNELRWDAYPLGNGHYLVPQAGANDSFAACQLAMRLSRGETLQEATQVVRRDPVSGEQRQQPLQRDEVPPFRMAKELQDDTGLQTVELRHSPGTSEQFQRHVADLRTRLAARGPGMLAAGDRAYVLYDIRQADGATTGQALVGDPMTARAHVVDFGPDAMSLLPPGIGKRDMTADSSSVIFLEPKPQSGALHQALQSLSSPDVNVFNAYLAEGCRADLAGMTSSPGEFDRLCSLLQAHMKSERTDGTACRAFIEGAAAFRADLVAASADSDSAGACLASWDRLMSQMR